MNLRKCNSAWIYGIDISSLIHLKYVQFIIYMALSLVSLVDTIKKKLQCSIVMDIHVLKHQQ
jgi:hypothetical protein